MRAIDFRLRPPYKTYLNSFMYDMQALEKSHRDRQLGPVSEAAQRHSVDLLVDEMDRAGIVWGVAPVRVPSNATNEDAVGLMAEYPGHFIAIPWIDPLNPQQAQAEIKKYCIDGPCKGIIVEPGLCTTPTKWFVNDNTVFPVYDYCQQAGIPILFSFGGRVADPKYYNPQLIYEIARIFPKLKIVLCHGGWPFVTEICKVAVDCSNVYLSPDTWMMDFSPGAADYIVAANYMLQDQILFGTSYPAIPLTRAVTNYTSRLRPEVVDKILYQNGARIFGL